MSSENYLLRKSFLEETRKAVDIAVKRMGNNLEGYGMSKNKCKKPYCDGQIPEGNNYCSVSCWSFCEQYDTSVQAAEKSIRDRNVGNSDYSKHTIQPWDIWLEYELNPWDADIVKRVLRTKEGDTRRMDYEKIIHICQERIRQLGE